MTADSVEGTSEWRRLEQSSPWMEWNLAVEYIEDWAKALIVETWTKSQVTVSPLPRLVDPSAENFQEFIKRVIEFYAFKVIIL